MVFSCNHERAKKVFVCIGQTGHGKSSLINTVLRATQYSGPFAQEDETYSCTKQIYSFKTQLLNCDIIFIDTPGLEDTIADPTKKLTNKNIFRMIAPYLINELSDNKFIPQIEGFLFVINPSAHRVAFQKILDPYESLFGKQFYQKLIVIYTHYDLAQDPEDKTAISRRKFQKDIEKCLYEKCPSINWKGNQWDWINNEAPKFKEQRERQLDFLKHFLLRVNKKFLQTDRLSRMVENIEFQALKEFSKKFDSVCKTEMKQCTLLSNSKIVPFKPQTFLDYCKVGTKIFCAGLITAGVATAVVGTGGAAAYVLITNPTGIALAEAASMSAGLLMTQISALFTAKKVLTVTIISLKKRQFQKHSKKMKLFQ